MHINLLAILSVVLKSFGSHGNTLTFDWFCFLLKKCHFFITPFVLCYKRRNSVFFLPKKLIIHWMKCQSIGFYNDPIQPLVEDDSQEVFAWTLGQVNARVFCLFLYIQQQRKVHSRHFSISIIWKQGRGADQPPSQLLAFSAQLTCLTTHFF